MLKNVYLFTGEETLLIRKETQRRKTAFEERVGDNTSFVFNTENFDNNNVLQTVFGSSFFADATLTIIKDIPTPANTSSTKYEPFINEFLAREGRIPKSSFLVFASSNPDKRTKLYKFLKKNANIKTFNRLKKAEIKRYIKTTLGNLIIQEDAVEEFIARIGEDLGNITNELDKIIRRCEANNCEEITSTHIEQLTFSYTKEDAFKFFGKLFKQDTKNILSFIDNMENEQTNWNAFSGSIYWTLNLYLTLLDFFDQGKTSYDEIKTIYKINPFVLKINLGQKDKIITFKKELKQMYSSLIMLDNSIKKGEKKAEEFRIELKRMVLPFTLQNEY